MITSPRGLPGRRFPVWKTCRRPSASYRRLALESDHLTVAALSLLESALGKRSRLVRLSGLIESLRARKEPSEIACIRRAVQLASSLFPALLRSLRPGLTELSVAARLEFAARRAGASAMSFETIVASGRRSAFPHGLASSALLPASGFVVLDYGVVLGGYSSDMTRTVHLGKASAERRSVYEAVLEAQLAAIASVRSGVRAGEVDQAARRVLRRSRLARYFTHSTGHGVGLEIHELPRLGRSSDAVLEPGMVVTIEPGVYLPGRFGVRIEDMLLVTSRGCEILTPAPKALIEWM